MADIPHIIKYMGSKRSIIDFVEEAILALHTRADQRLYDVFGGSAVVSAAFRNRMNVTCNDIQEYTSVLAGTYLKNYHWEEFPDDILDQIVAAATVHVKDFQRQHKDLRFKYTPKMRLKRVLEIETQERSLQQLEFDTDDHLFTRHFSGTYWSFNQCLWIDALSSVARSERFRDTFVYNVIMSSLMFAMAYCTQSTGHYAQYRDLTKDNLKDILFYRTKELLPLFRQKFESLKEFYNGSNNHVFNHRFTNLDFLELLKNMEPGSIVYADPPYQFVHYSRFYHALETLTKYDYPELQYKGRYRSDRHQSPFSIRSKVKGAFRGMFEQIAAHNSSLVLSYSDNGLISLAELITLSDEIFSNYCINIEEIHYLHSTMGRQKDKSRLVKEALLICRPSPNAKQLAERVVEVPMDAENE